MSYSGLVKKTNWSDRLPVSDALIDYLISDFNERPVPSGISRDIALPGMPGKADVLIGMRRSGKTYRLYQEMRRLLGEGVPKSRMLFLNLEDDRLGPADVSVLNRALELLYRRDPTAREKGAYLFLDELQAVKSWEAFCRRVLDTESARLYITGSSAKMLSAEVATQFRGRGVTVEVLPFSVAEARRTHGGVERGADSPPGAVDRSARAAFVDAYLSRGGFPEVQQIGDLDRIQLLQQYVDLVVLRDVAERHGATNLHALRALVDAMFSANSCPFSVSKLHGVLKSQGVAVSKGTLLTYVGHLVDAYLFFLVPIRTRSARRRAVNPRKLYAIDTGLATAMSAAGAQDVGARLENAVYLHLRRGLGTLADRAVTYHKTEDGLEVDFVVDIPGQPGPELIQVSADISDPRTRERELRALEQAMQELGVSGSTLVTMSSEEEVQIPAGLVKVVPAWRWFFEQ